MNDYLSKIADRSWLHDGGMMIEPNDVELERPMFSSILRYSDDKIDGNVVIYMNTCKLQNS